MFAFVAHNQFSYAVYFCVNIAASDIAEDPEFSLFSRQSCEGSDFFEFDSVIYFAESFEVEEIQTFDKFLLKWSQKDVFLNTLLAFLNFLSSCFEIILNLQGWNILGEAVGVFDVFSVDNFWQFEKIECSIILEGFVQYYCNSHVPEHFWAGELKNWEVAFIICAEINKFLELFISSLPEDHKEWEQEEFFFLNI